MGESQFLDRVGFCSSSENDLITEGNDGGPFVQVGHF